MPNSVSTRNMTVELDDRIPIAAANLLLLPCPILQQPNPFAIALSPLATAPAAAERSKLPMPIGTLIFLALSLDRLAIASPPARLSLGQNQRPCICRQG